MGLEHWKGGFTVDWNTLKAEYIAGGVSYRELAEKHGVSESTLRKRAAKEHWSELRNKAGTATEQKIVDKTAEDSANKAVELSTRIDDIADKLLDKIERAVDELDIHLVKSTTKEKVVKYNSKTKPIKETIVENETINEVSSLIDRRGLQQLTSALKEIKDIKDIKSQKDAEEQQARIDNLKKQAQDNGAGANTIEVEFGDAEAYSK